MRSQAWLFITCLILAVFALTFQYILPDMLVRLAAAGLLGGLFAIAVVGNPKFGLLVAAFYVFADLTYLFNVSAGYPIVVLVAFGVVIKLLAGDSVHARDTFFNVAITIFTMIALQSLLFARDTASYWEAFSAYLKVMLLTYLAIQVLRTPRDLQTYALTIFAGTLATIGLGLLKLVYGGAADASVIGEINTIRFSGLHPNPNNAALYMVATFPIALYGLKRYRSVLYRLFFGAASLIIVLSTVGSFSRAALFPLFVVAIVSLIREARSAKVYVITGAVVVASLFLAPSFYWQRLMSVRELFSSDVVTDWSFYTRLMATRAGWELVGKHPIFGVGLNNFLDRSAGLMSVHTGVHNTYLDLLIGLGVTGFAAFFLIQVAAVRAFVRALRARWRPDYGWCKDLIFCLLLSHLATLIGALFQDVAFYYVMWLSLAGGLVAYNLSKEPRYVEIDGNSEGPSG